jgi:hypothetical protein
MMALSCRIISTDSAATDQRQDRFRLAQASMEQHMMPFYSVRHVGGEHEELSCLQQLDDECAAMYFNVVHSARIGRRFTTEQVGEKCEDFVLVARDVGTGAGLLQEREISLFDKAKS